LVSLASILVVMRLAGHAKLSTTESYLKGHNIQHLMDWKKVYDPEEKEEEERRDEFGTVEILQKIRFDLYLNLFVMLPNALHRLLVQFWRPCH